VKSTTHHISSLLRVLYTNFRPVQIIRYVIIYFPLYSYPSRNMFFRTIKPGELALVFIWTRVKEKRYLHCHVKVPWA